MMDRPNQAEEALLLASPNAWAADYIVQRGTKATSRYWDSISKETEAKLLERQDRFVDLRLAEYCRHPETAHALFARDPADWAIRSLVLSNQILALSLFRGFPEGLFGSEEALLSYLSSITPDDTWVLFGNPTLNDHFIERVLGLGDCWQAMPEATRHYAIGALAANTKLHKSVSTADYDDGWDWHVAGKPFAAAWRLVIGLDATSENAEQLARLYDRLARYCLETDDILDAIPRWTPTTADDVEKEAKDNERGYLSSYQRIRRAASAMLLSGYKLKPADFLQSEDPMIRCGAYAAGDFNAKEMARALERDGWFAAAALIENPKCWKTDEQRDVLRDGVGSAPRDSISWDYRQQAQRHEAEHPEWFAYEEIDLAPVDRPLTESSLSDVSQHMLSTPAFSALRANVDGLAKALRVQQWLIVAIILLLIFRR